MNETAHLRAAVVEAPLGELAARPSQTTRFRPLGALLEVGREQAWFIGIALAYLLVGLAVARAYGQSISLNLYNDVHLVLYANFALFWIIFRTTKTLAKHRPARPLRFAWDDLRAGILSSRRLLNALPAFVLLPLVLSMTTSLKRMIPLITPFYLDPALIEIDRVLHGGVHPWQLLQPILGYPIVTAAISNAYSLPWYTVMLLMQFWQTFTLDRRRLRVLMTYVMCWALMGNAMATVLSSAGPCYYGFLFDGTDPFAPLMSYLGSVAESYAVPSYMAQQYLWENYQTDFLRLGSGISAMPSLHISMGLLLVFATWHLHRAVRIAAIAFLVVLQVGAVHLGWHYAVDGYVAALGTAVIWWAVGRALERRELRRGPRGAGRGRAGP